MRIDHLNAYLTGGAAVAARRLHHGLLADGVESRFWFSGDSGGRRDSAPDASYRQIAWGMPPIWDVLRFGPSAIRWGWERGLRTYYRRGGAVRPGMYNGPIRPYPTPFAPTDRLPDLLHLHWVSRIIDYRSFFGLLRAGLPLVWTLYNMLPLTGGCHHAQPQDSGSLAAKLAILAKDAALRNKTASRTIFLCRLPFRVVLLCRFLLRPELAHAAF